ETHALHQTIRTHKMLVSVAQHALEVGAILGLPDGLQMDNDAAFCGGYKAPRVFGQLVRWCLYFGIAPIFIPPHEAQRHGAVERLNGLWSKSFWQRQPSPSPAAVARARPKFEQWYAQEYEPPSLNGATPAPALAATERRRLTVRQMRTLPDELPITAGRLHFIRRVEPDGAIAVLNESWKVDKRLAGQYVW